MGGEEECREEIGNSLKTCHYSNRRSLNLRWYQFPKSDLCVIMSWVFFFKVSHDSIVQTGMETTVRAVGKLDVRVTKKRDL